MQTVIVDNKEIPIDIYGRIIGAEVVTEIATSLGLMECRLRKTLHEGRLVVEADLWQGTNDGKERNLPITSFRAGVLMQWEKTRFRIINKYYREANDLWRELEILISNAIMVNV